MHVQTLAPATQYIYSLPQFERSKVIEDVQILAQTDTRSVRTKQLKGPIRELIVGDHRLTYFKLLDTLYFVRGFRKQSRKTPPAEIQYAEKVYKAIKESL